MTILHCPINFHVGGNNSAQPNHCMPMMLASRSTPTAALSKMRNNQKGESSVEAAALVWAAILPELQLTSSADLEVAELFLPPSEACKKMESSERLSSTSRCKYECQYAYKQMTHINKHIYKPIFIYIYMCIHMYI